MMGRLNREQAQFFYSFSLEEIVPDDHLVRKIATVCRFGVGTQGARTLLFQHWSAID